MTRPRRPSRVDRKRGEGSLAGFALGGFLVGVLVTFVPVAFTADGRIAEAELEAATCAGAYADSLRYEREQADSLSRVNEHLEAALADLLRRAYIKERKGVDHEGGEDGAGRREGRPP